MNDLGLFLGTSRIHTVLFGFSPNQAAHLEQSREIHSTAMHSARWSKLHSPD